MNSEFEYLEDKDIVLVRTSGSYDLGAEEDTVRKAIAKLEEHNCSRCIFDHRATNVIARTMDSFNRPELFGDLGLERFVRTALVFRELTEDVTCYENVCVNRGWQVRAFDDYDAAIDWVTKQVSAL